MDSSTFGNNVNDGWGDAPSTNNWDDMDNQTPPPAPAEVSGLDNVDVRQQVVELIGTSEHCRERFILKKGPNVIGRSRDSDICVNFQGVSRRHAVIEVADSGDVRIWDENSGNGTSLGGKRLEPGKRYQLQDHDIIIFSQAQFTLTIKQAEPAARPAPMSRVPTPAARPAGHHGTTSPTMVNMTLSTPELDDNANSLEHKLEVIEQERRHLAILFQLSLRYLSRDPDENPATILFKFLHKIVPFDAAFLAMPAGEGHFRFATNPHGIRLAKPEYSQIAREGDPGKTVVFDAPDQAIQLTDINAAARAIIPFSNGGFLVLISKTSGIYAKQVEFLDLLGRLHSAVAI